MAEAVFCVFDSFVRRLGGGRANQRDNIQGLSAQGRLHLSGNGPDGAFSDNPPGQGDMRLCLRVRNRKSQLVNKMVNRWQPGWCVLPWARCSVWINDFGFKKLVPIIHYGEG